ncbi:MAG: GNAT family N-acetyltransferase [Robiginitalea sp.]|nr:GNAT family N-acetyltransferase [Robiginitalea sp.]
MAQSRTAFIHTDSGDKGFQKLVALLDSELAERDGSQHAFYHQFNGLEGLDRVVLGLVDGQVVGCGALKEFKLDTLEVKRMFTLPEYRGGGLAGKLLLELEQWASEDGYSRIILETGRRQPEAIGLYRKHGYRRTENYGPYVGVSNSLCFEKRLKEGKP